MVGLLHTFQQSAGVVKDSDQYLDHLMHPTDHAVVASVDKQHLDANGGWYRASGTTTYLAPYWAALEKWTGQGAFALDLMPILLEGFGWQMGYAVLETFSVDEVGEATFTGYVCHFRPWNGRVENPESQANMRLQEWVARVLGAIETVPEYLPTGNGLFKENPQYGKGSRPALQVVGNEDVWNGIWAAWVGRFATDDQKALLERMHVSFNHDPHVPKANGATFYADGCKTVVKLDEFRALGNATAHAK